MRVEQQADRSSEGRSLAALVLGAGCALAGAIALWVWLLGQLRVAALGSTWLVKQPEPALFTGAGLLLLLALLRRREWRRWLGLAPGRRLSLRGANPLHWLGVLATLVLFAAQLHTAVEEAADSPQKARKSRRNGPAEMSVNRHNRHAGPMVRSLVQRESAEPVVVRIDDRDHRGHTLAFYLYPRLILMEPGERIWTLRHRMTKSGGPNPIFDVDERPPAEHSRAFAARRGTIVVTSEHTRRKQRNDR